MTSPDWVAWHRDYETPTSSLARRRGVVRRLMAAELARRPVSRIISVCAGDGGDVLAEVPARFAGRILLVEADAQLCARAQQLADERSLSGVVEVSQRDAGSTTAYREFVPADIALLCGVFGNIPAADVERTIAELPALLADHAAVIWTRGRKVTDPTPQIRACFTRHGFTEEAFVAPADAVFSVGLARFTGVPASFRPGRQLFTFVRGA